MQSHKSVHNKTCLSYDPLIYYNMKPHPAGQPEQLLLRDCQIVRTRTGGPGGQHRNKVETAIRITHKPTGLRAIAYEERSQAKNKKRAIQRLRIRLAIQHRTACDVDTYTPSSCLADRVRKGRIALSHKHDDYPPILAELLDLLVALDGDVAAAAELIGSTASQIVKHLRVESDALGVVNDLRRQTGARALR